MSENITSQQQTLFVADSPVSLTAWQVIEKRVGTSATCGVKRPVLLASLSPDGLWVKMYRGYYLARLDGSLVEYSATWPRAGMLLSGKLYLLPFGAPHIRERVFIIAHSECIPEPFSEVPGRECEEALEPGWDGVSQSISDYDGEHSQKQWQSVTSSEAYTGFRRGRGWEVEPAVGRVVDGFPGRVDQLKGLGNAVVPLVAEFVGSCIMQAEEVRQALSFL